MIDITKSSFLKYFLFASLYFTEGLQYIIASLILPIYLVDKGIPISLVTVIAAVYLIPMTIKFIWGGIVDYFNKYGRRKFIILGGLLTFFSLFFLFIIDPSEYLAIFTIFLFLAGCGVGFLDVSADAWAIDISKYEESLAIHGRVIKGISGDGTPAGTRFSIVDPDGGREYTENVENFVDSFEREARETNFPLRIQVFHWPAGTRPGSMSYRSVTAFDAYSAPFQQSTTIFTPQAIQRMKDFLVQNATGGSPQSCIGTMNEGLRRLFDDHSIPVGSEVHTTMEALRQAGHASNRYDIEFKDASGNTTRGERPPESLSESLLTRMLAMNGAATGWSVFGLSIMDGYHSVLLSLDNSDPAQPKIYWSDQWPSNGGWLALDGAGLDSRVISLTKRWYPEFIAEKERRTGKKVAPRTRTTLWMVIS